MSKDIVASVRKWIATSTGARKSPDSFELLLLPSGSNEPLWKQSMEQVESVKPMEVAAELIEVSERHARERGSSARFFLRWVDDAANVIIGTTWRLGDGPANLDGSPEALSVMQQKYIDTLQSRAAEREDAWLSAFQKITTMLVEENTLLRQEAREVRLLGNESSAPRDDASDDKPAHSRARGSHLDAAIANLVEAAGKKYIDKMLTADASGSASNDDKPERAADE